MSMIKDHLSYYGLISNNLTIDIDQKLIGLGGHIPRRRDYKLSRISHPIIIKDYSITKRFFFYSCNFKILSERLRFDEAESIQYISRILLVYTPIPQ